MIGKVLGGVDTPSSTPHCVSDSSLPPRKEVGTPSVIMLLRHFGVSFSYSHFIIQVCHKNNENLLQTV